VEIIRLRGLFDKPTRWKETNDLVWRGWQATNYLIGPSEVEAFLRDYGPNSKVLSDDGLVMMIILMQTMHREGD
jgi:hypothetical protein